MAVAEIDPASYKLADIIVHLLIIFIVSAALFGIEEIAEHLVSDVLTRVGWVCG